jgi:hypothetical protein
MSGTVLREIDDMWQDELLAPPLGDDYPEPVGGQRVTHFQAYMNKVDWAEPAQVARALKVFEVALRFLFQPPDARLAINGARLWCEFMLDTLADPNAPWRRSSGTSTGE